MALVLLIGDEHVGGGHQLSFNQPDGASALWFLNRSCNEVKESSLIIPSIHSGLQKQATVYAWITGAPTIQLGFFKVAKKQQGNSSSPDGRLNK